MRVAGECDEVSDFDADALADERILGEMVAQIFGFARVSSIEGGERGERCVAHFIFAIQDKGTKPRCENSRCGFVP